MNKLALPTTLQLFFPALFTFTRRPTIKSQMKEIKKEYTFEKFESNNLANYKNLLNYNDDSIPLTYLYLLAQRAQIALMLDKNFIFALIGMVHMDNEMELFKEVASNSPIDIEVSSTQYFNEEKNRIEVNFLVNFKQNNKLIANCKSKYLALSGKRPKQEKKSVPAQNDDNNFKKIGDNSFKVKDARTYAHVSGDYNFIHLSPLLAKLFGFKSSILHGMYTTGLVGSQIKNSTNKNLKRLYVQFKKPLLLPNEIEHFISDYSNNKGELKVISPKGNKEILTGSFEVF